MPATHLKSISSWKNLESEKIFIYAEWQRDREASLKLSWTLTMIRFPKKAVADRHCHCTRDIRPITDESTTSTREIHIYSFLFFLWCIIYSRGFSWNIFSVCFKKTSIWVCLLSEIPPWNTVSIIWCGWGRGVGKKTTETRETKDFPFFNSRMRIFGCFVIMESSSLKKNETICRNFSSERTECGAHWMREINHNVYIWAGFECWRSQTNYGWQNKGSALHRQQNWKKFISQIRQRVKQHIERTAMSYVGLKIAEKIIFFLHSFHVIV